MGTQQLLLLVAAIVVVAMLSLMMAQNVSTYGRRLAATKLNTEATTIAFDVSKYVAKRNKEHGEDVDSLLTVIDFHDFGYIGHERQYSTVFGNFFLATYHENCNPSSGYDFVIYGTNETDEVCAIAYSLHPDSIQTYATY